MRYRTGLSQRFRYRDYHPHPATVRVLQQMVYRLPADEPRVFRAACSTNRRYTSRPRNAAENDAPQLLSRSVKMRKPKTAATAHAYALFSVIGEHYAKFLRGCLVSAIAARLGKIAAPKNVSAKMIERLTGHTTVRTRFYRAIATAGKTRAASDKPLRAADVLASSVHTCQKQKFRQSYAGGSKYFSPLRQV